jgi:hypothetical protein
VAVIVTGHAPQDFTEKVRQTVRDAVLRVERIFKGSHVVAWDRQSAVHLPSGKS